MVRGVEGFTSTWQPHMASLSHTAGDMRSRIDAYDQAAQDPMAFAKPLQQDTFTDRTLGEQWSACSTHKILRDVGGTWLDDHIKPPEPIAQSLKALGKKGNPFAQATLLYDDVFKIDPHMVQTGGNTAYQSELKCLLSSQGRKDLANSALSNFRSVKIPTISLKNYLKRVVVAGNISDVTESLANERFFTGIFKTGWLFLGALPVLERTKAKYKETRSFWQSAKTFSKEGLKALASWEFASIGTLVGAMLCPMKGFAMIITKGLCMGLFSAVAHKSLDKTIP